MNAIFSATLNTFLAHSQERGLELLEGDKKFIQCKCRGLGQEALKRVLNGYFTAWQSAAKFEQLPSKKQNAGRRAANIYLDSGLS